MGAMKKMTALFVCVLMLAQAAGVVYAGTGSFDESQVQQEGRTIAGVDVPALGSVADEALASSSDVQQSYQHSCHGHCHIHMSVTVQPLEAASPQRDVSSPDYYQRITGLVHGPDSPPPNSL
jgi:hypothetical protein